MLKYLITGGCGFIGSTLAHALCRQGASVRVLDNLSTGKKENLPSQAELVVGDIRDPKALKTALEGVSGCFHLAAVASMEKSIENLSQTSEINLLGTLRLIEAICATQKKIPIVFTSSAAVYGSCKDRPLKESSIPNPLSPYGIDKWGAEKHLQAAFLLHGIPSCSFRLFNVYGPCQESGAISIFARKLNEGMKLTIFGDGNQKRDFIFVDDVVEFLIKAMMGKMTGANLFNLATNRSVSLKEVIALLEKKMKKKAVLEFAEVKQGDIVDSCGDASSLMRFFGKEATTKLEEGLEKCVKSLR